MYKIPLLCPLLLRTPQKLRIHLTFLRISAFRDREPSVYFSPPFSLYTGKGTHLTSWGEQHKSMLLGSSSPSRVHSEGKTLALSPTYNLYSNFTFNKADILIPFGSS